MRDLFAIFFGRILMIVADGVFLPEALATALDKTFQNNLTTRTGSPELQERIS